MGQMLSEGQGTEVRPGSSKEEDTGNLDNSTAVPRKEAGRGQKGEEVEMTTTDTTEIFSVKGADQWASSRRIRNIKRKISRGRRNQHICICCSKRENVTISKAQGTGQQQGLWVGDQDWDLLPKWQGWASGSSMDILSLVTGRLYGTPAGRAWGR